ncbi:hypothetical protein C8J56DRAFT_799466 [Mycena floridula]|nr:hypothetical protein C8J56DRAFT_799466 [Mycena floridula]
MFNAPRAAQRTYNSGNGFGASSYVDENPLAGSAYDSVDPWSAAPSPSSTPAPQAASVFSAVIADADAPAIYNQAFLAVDPAGSGEASVSSLSRVLSTSSLPASTIEKIVNLVSSRPRVSKLEFFVALALVALAQSGKDVSIEQVAALSSQNTLPEPSLNLDTLQPSNGLSTFVTPNYRQNSNDAIIRSPAPTYGTVADDPWNSNPNTRFAVPPFDSQPETTNTSSHFGGSGLPSEWWKKQQTVSVSILGQQGFILNRYTVYEVKTDRGPPVTRRYSEFSFLWECLVRRYPFRLFPALPPKRIGPDEYFLEQRRRGLSRCLNFVVNHPVIKEDGLLAVFITEPSFEEWRKHTSVSLDEESTSKRVDRVEEMTIPSDLEEKIAIVRGKVSPLIDQWQRICILAERIIKRREAAAVRVPSTFSARKFLPAHLSSSASTSSSSSNPPSIPTASTVSLADSLFGFTPMTISLPSPDQSDLSRLTNTVKTVIEVNERCWRGDDCELSDGVRQGLEQVAAHAQRHSELSEMRTRALFDVTLESLKSQRDLYMALRDLFIRHDRLSLDQVERLKKRVESTSLKLDGIKAAQKEGWQDEADKLVGMIERDQATIAAQLSRRVFIRACLWHELRVVLHNRENTMLTVLVQTFAREEVEFAESATSNWQSLQDNVEGMPLE